MAEYEALYPIGSRVRIASKTRLEDFKRTWRFHHPLAAEQLAYADREAMVRDVSFYHGGDVLYELESVPGIWHQECLSSIEPKGAA
jgi:hypothetical protein